MNKNIIDKMFPKAIGLIENKKCPICEVNIIVEELKDELSVKEYKISGMCQACQDKTFG